MLISKLIEELQKLQKEVPEAEVRIFDSDSAQYADIDFQLGFLESGVKVVGLFTTKPADY